MANHLDMLRKEIMILQELTKMRHKNIVSMLDCRDSQHKVFIVLEFCNGGDLASYLRKKGILREETIRIFVKQIGE
jgi:serine/threonine-protein kinase ULK/ATG1